MKKMILATALACDWRESRTSSRSWVLNDSEIASMGVYPIFSKLRSNAQGRGISVFSLPCDTIKVYRYAFNLTSEPY
jgi:hypothetical protein